MKKICVFTATRAEYGILVPLINKLRSSDHFELQIVALGAHLSPEFAYTYKEIENDGYIINEKIEVLLSSETSIGVSKTMGLIQISCAEVMNRLNPDMIIVLGDRYEIFSVAATALVLNVPVAHIHGGELTEGAIDDSIRHAITKMSHLHFTSTEVYRQRVIQLGENPNSVYNVGSLGVENIKMLKLLDKETLECEIGFNLDGDVAVVTFHPVTNEERDTLSQMDALLDVLMENKNLKIVFTKANADVNGRAINKKIDQFVERHADRATAFISLGRIRYLSLLQYTEVVVGNSSSGIIEAPEFNIPVVNIGNRQKGRVSSKVVIHCDAEKQSIKAALSEALTHDFREKAKIIPNIYGLGDASEQILSTLETYLSTNKHKLPKQFYDISY